MSEPDEPPTSGLPTVVLVAGLVTTAFATLTFLVHLRHPIDGVVPFLVPVLGLGLALIGLWVKWKVRGQLGPPVRVGEVPTNAPGPWYPVAICAIAVLLVVWLLVYKKL